MCSSDLDPAAPGKPAGIPLAAAATNTRLRITALVAGRGLVERLSDMGLPIGSEIEVIQRQTGGRLIVARDFVRIALGGGMAQKIIVEPVGSEGE